MTFCLDIDAIRSTLLIKNVLPRHLPRYVEASSGQPSINFTTMVTASDLPVELHAEIVQSLHHYQDRHTLLCTALVNKDWCAVSQPILFSIVTDHCEYNTNCLESVMLTHTLFLRTIAKHPHRLGPLVHSYVQDSLAYSPVASKPIVLEQTMYSHIH